MRVIDIVQRTGLKVIATMYFASLQEAAGAVKGSSQFGHYYIPTAAASRARPLNKCKITFENLFNYLLNSHGLELCVQRILLFTV